MITALILAGGRATRLGGIDKTALVIAGETIFARQVRVLAPRTTALLVSLGQEKGSDPFPRPVTGQEKGSDPILGQARVVVDRLSGVGPLAGVHAGLVACTTTWLLVIAGDMPNIEGALVDRLVAARSDGCDAVGIRIEGLPEPLLCLLRRDAALAALERMLAAGQRKASDLLTGAGLRVAWIEDVNRAWLTNINTPDDLR